MLVQNNKLNIYNQKTRAVAAIIIALFIWILVFQIIQMATGRIDWYWKWAHYFTTQSNYVVGITAIIYFINMKKNFLKTTNLFIMATAYITVTFLIYNGLLLKGDIQDSIGHADIAFWKWIDGVPEHMIVPIVTVVWYFLIIKQLDKRQYINKYWKIAVYGMIYPTLYLTYVIVINLVKVDGEYHTVYGTFTNINKDFIYKDKAGSLSGLALEGATWLLFLGLLSFYWGIHKYLTRKNK